ncbi:DNA-directed RNA polymerase subunit omega [Lujinxingia vulgaris]|uniref:DNA-directed RNA polymerase subunit omega n=2 Tax=Lujinxingia TaxID=2653226 RepID=A0A5C6X4V1_9DELT|nr:MULTISPECIES: DNA-directed RNA polymerase subunit omega [Lujinxingia]RDV38292.1 DNA-directed RNA polymerase subunit omega [Bradymonadaceae bacterium TMQ3]TXC75966.1 DNA-directed RNA polymerase subunit omega [Bradymonadales bacterium TMQ1]RVU43505.1 DNA-directed RNA polymerase subunit omega [Lujinxingia sediminis]TXD31414.1 DNA-directed RNA polymerase subunit omega [Lujinxingia vulgaris]TXD35839.1 DNA-directed RNA polymerase subunit omega [Lujinxingia vulgaris]
MARVTVEDCLEHIENRFALVMLATQRARELRRSNDRIFPSSNKEAVHSLREIGAGFVRFDEKSKRKLSKALGHDELAAEQAEKG